MRRFGRPIVAIFVAYALLLAPLLGGLAAGRLAEQNFALCAAAAADRGAPAETITHDLCCVLGACAGAAPALAPGVRTAIAPPTNRAAVDAALSASLDRIESQVSAPPRGPPARA